MCAIKLSENEISIIGGYDKESGIFSHIDFVRKFGEGQKKGGQNLKKKVVLKNQSGFFSSLSKRAFKSSFIGCLL